MERAAENHRAIARRTTGSGARDNVEVHTPLLLKVSFLSHSLWRPGPHTHLRCENLISQKGSVILCEGGSHNQ